MKTPLKLLVPVLLLLLTLSVTASPNFINAGTMSSPRREHTATLLPNGKVLVAAGTVYGYSNCLATTDLFNPTNGLWRNTGSLNTPRMRQTATLLSNGKVLVAGGDGSSPFLSSAELYDSATETWTNTGSLNIGRELHTMTLLANGKVLVVGGAHTNVVPHSLSSAELYDPTTGTWMATGSLNAPRYHHTATLLPNGKVLVVGGLNDYFNGPNGQGLPLPSAELYDPTTEQWTYTAQMSTNRYDHTATLLPNGKVLVVGGSDWINACSSAELYDPATELWTPTGSLNTVRKWHTATLLPNGKVLVAGGGYSDTNYNTITLSSAELYDPTFGIWTAAGTMTDARGYGHKATLLPGGNVLFTGGLGTNSTLSSAELYDPNAQGNLPPPPALGISTYSNQPTVFFPTAAGGNYVLQMTTNLASDNWVTVSNGIPISGLIITNPPDNAFFRLH